MNKKSPKTEKLVKDYFENKGLPLSPALTFDDVQIINNISDVHSRSDIKDLKAPISKNFSLNIPVVSANMDTVTDARMAIGLARLGGLGFIHQFFPLEQRIAEAMKVKRADNALVDDPFTILYTATFKEAKEKMFKNGISSLLVIDEKHRLKGILTSRDYRFKTDDALLVSKIMKPMPLITALPGIHRKDAEKILEENRIEKLPIVDKHGVLKGMITAKDILKEKEFPNAIKDNKGRLAVGVALRLSNDYVEEAKQLVAVGVDVLLLDTARAGAIMVGEAVKKVKKALPNIPLIVGNIDTPEEVEFLAKAGADCVKVGIGPGAACKTQEETGVGLPQIHAIASCAAVAKKMGIHIIADGGIRNGACLSKALVAGADAVMVGSLLAGTDEAPGVLIKKGNQLWKVYRGSASFEHQLDRIKTGSLDAIRNPEGESGLIPYSGSAKSVLDGLTGGLRSSMSYVGSRSITEYWKKGKFVWRTNAGRDEGRPRV